MNDMQNMPAPHIFDDIGPYLIGLIWVALLVGAFMLLKGIFSGAKKDSE